jgi:hypothetical protein
MSGLNPLAIDIQDLPTVMFGERSRLPRMSAVYFALGVSDTVLYIGKTQDLWKRWRFHHRLQQLMDMGCLRIAWYGAKRDILLTLEIPLIDAYKPPLNKRLGPPNPERPHNKKGDKKFTQFSFPESEHRQLKATLASRGDTFAGWFRRKVREELGLQGEAAEETCAEEPAHG